VVKKIFFGLGLAVILVIGLAACSISDTDIIDSGKNLYEGGKDFLDTTVYDIDDETVFNDNYEILSGDLERRQIADSSVHDMDVSLAGGTLMIKNSGDGNYYVEGIGVEKMQAYSENGKAYVHALRNSNITDEMTITFYVPIDNGIINADISLGAGYIEIDNLVANNIDFHVGAGGIKALVLPTQSMKLTCDMGNVDLTMSGTEESYDYLISVTAGNVSIGDEDYPVVNRKEVDNGAGTCLEVTCTMGNVSVGFTE